MSGGYSLALGGATIANNTPVTMAFINSTNAPNLTLKFRRFWVGQSNNMASTNLRVQISTQVSVFPTLISQTPAKLATADAASIITGGTAGAAGTCGVTASAELGGTKTVVWPDAFNVVNGWLLVPTPEEAIEGAAGTLPGLGLVFPIPPGTLTNWAFGFTWIEA